MISPIPLLTIFLLVAVICALAFMCWRTQSLHFLLRRFWLLVHGNKDIPDPQIQAFSQEQTSLYAFRLFSGTQVQSLEQAHQLIAWSQQQKVPMATISACGDCFDLEKHQVLTEKLHGKFYRASLFLGLCVLIVCTTCSVFMALSKPGIATLKATNHWVILNEDNIEKLFALPFVTTALDRGDCQKQYPNRLRTSQFNAEEIEIICDLLKVKDWDKHVAKTKKEQRKILLLMALLGIFCIGIFCQNINQQYHARELHKKLTHHKEIENEHTTT